VLSVHRFPEFQLEHLDEARNAYEGAVLRSPEMLEGYQGLLEIYTKKNDSEYIRSTLEKILKYVKPGSKQSFKYGCELAKIVAQEDQAGGLAIALNAVGGRPQCSNTERPPSTKSSRLPCWQLITKLQETMDEVRRKRVLQERCKSMREELKAKALAKARGFKKQNIEKAPAAALSPAKKQELEETLRRELLQETELDDLYRQSAASNEESYESLIERLRLRLAIAEGDAYLQLRDRVLQEARWMNEFHPNNAFCKRVILSLTLYHQMASPVSDIEIWKDQWNMTQKLIELNEKDVVARAVQAVLVFAAHQANDRRLTLEEEEHLHNASVYVDFAFNYIPIRVKGKKLLSPKMKPHQWPRISAIAFAVQSYMQSKNDDIPIAFRINQYCKKALQTIKDIIEGDPTIGPTQTFVELTLGEIFLLGAKPKLEKAKELFERGLDASGIANPRALEGLCRAMILDKKYDEVTDLCNKYSGEEGSKEHIFTNSLLGWVHFLCGEYKKAKDLLEFVVKSPLVSSIDHYRLGLTYWFLGGTFQSEKQYAYTSFLNSVRADPQNADAFSYIGHHFAVVKNDQANAEKCYIKSLNIDPANRESGIALGAMYLKAGKKDAAFKVFDNAHRKDKAAYWALLPAAAIKKDRKDWAESVKLYQDALRGKSYSAAAWGSLCEAYTGAGKYLTAIKCGQKALELSTEKDNPRLSVTLSKAMLMMGQLDEALEVLDTLVYRYENYLPGWVNYAMTKIVQVRQSLADGAFNVGKIAILETISSCKKCMSLPGGNCWSVNKLMADAYSYYAQFPPDEIDMSKQSGEKVYEAVRKQLRLVKEGDKWYAETLFLRKTAEVYGDRALNQLRGSVVASRWKQLQKEAQKLRSSAQVYAKMAVRLDCENPKYWTLLGLTTGGAASTHCYLKAYRLDPKAGGIPANLLAFNYLLEDKDTRAKQLFVINQGKDPTSPLMFSGLGWIKAARDFDLQNSLRCLERAVDLCPNSSALRTGTSFLLNATIKEDDINAKEERQRAMLLAQKAVAQEPLNGSARGVLAHLLELLGYPEKAYEHYYAVIAMAENENFMFSISHEEQMEARLGLVRSLVQAGMGKEAVAASESLDESVAKYILRGRAFALLKDHGNLRLEFDKALSLTQEDNEMQGLIVMVMAQAQYKSGQSTDAADNIKSFAEWRSEFKELKATIEICVGAFDDALDTLSAIAESDEEKLLSDERQALLTARCYIAKGKLTEAASVINKALDVGDIEDITRLTFLAARLELAKSSFETCRDLDGRKVGNELDRTDLEARATILSGVERVDNKAALSVFLNPDNLRGWALLAIVEAQHALRNPTPENLIAAIKGFSRVPNREPGFKKHARLVRALLRAMLYYHNGKENKPPVLRKFEEAELDAVDEALLLRVKAYLSLADDEIDTALELFSEAVETWAPDGLPIASEMCSLALRHDRPEEASTGWRNILSSIDLEESELGEDFIRCQASLGLACSLLGEEDLEEIEESLEAARDILVKKCEDTGGPHVENEEEEETEVNKVDSEMVEVMDPRLTALRQLEAMLTEE